MNEEGGARVSIRDPRVSSVLGWFWGVVGLAFVTCVGLAANNLYQLNVTVARAADNSIIMNSQLADHESRLRAVERDLSAVEGRVFRGVDGYQKVEPKHGD